MLIVCKGILNIEINPHIAAFRNDRHSFIILICLLHIIEADPYIIIASLIELFFDILCKFLLKCFVIHSFPLFLTRNLKIHNPVFIRDVLTVSIVIFCKIFLCISHISIICKLSHFVNGHISAVGLIINVISKIIRNFHHTEFFDIVMSQISIAFYSRIDFILIQVINKIDHIFNAACIITDLHCRLKMVIIMIIQLIELGSQIIEFIQVFIFSQLFIQPINITVIITNEPFFIRITEIIF